MTRRRGPACRRRLGYSTASRFTRSANCFRNFTTFGAQPGKNMARVALGAELKSRYGLSTGLTFEEAVSSRSQSYDGVFSFGYGW